MKVSDADLESPTSSSDDGTISREGAAGGDRGRPKNLKARVDG